MISSVRICGPEIGEARGYVDCDIVGATFNGSIILQEQGTSTQWSIECMRLEELARQDLVYDLSKVDTTAEDWAAIDDIESRYTASADSDKSHFVRAAKELFTGAEQ